MLPKLKLLDRKYTNNFLAEYDVKGYMEFWDESEYQKYLNGGEFKMKRNVKTDPGTPYDYWTTFGGHETWGLLYVVELPQELFEI